LQPGTREVFIQAFTDNQDERTFGNIADDTLMRPENVLKEMLVVLKRGNGVDYAVKEGSPYLPIDDIREYCPGMTWEEIKAQQAAWSRWGKTARTSSSTKTTTPTTTSSIMK
jgi:hypothetical protein